MKNINDISVKDEINLILLLDNSKSTDKNLSEIKLAISKLQFSLKRIVKNIDVKIRIVLFDDEVTWMVGKVEEGVSIQNVDVRYSVWKHLNGNGKKSILKVIYEVAKALKKEYLGEPFLRPIVILFTDGHLNPSEHDEYVKATEQLKICLSDSIDKEIVTCIAVGIGDYNKETLIEFASEGVISDIKQPLVFDSNKVFYLGEMIYNSYLKFYDEDDVINLGKPGWEDADKIKDEDYVYTYLYHYIDFYNEEDDEVIDLGEPVWFDDDID